MRLDWLGSKEEVNHFPIKWHVSKPLCNMNINQTCGTNLESHCWANPYRQYQHKHVLTPIGGVNRPRQPIASTNRVNRPHFRPRPHVENTHAHTQDTDKIHTNYRQYTNYTQDTSSLAFSWANTACTARKEIPGCSGIPSIVQVFPDPVWPYAKMQTLYPSRTDSIKGSTWANTCSWVVPGMNTLSNSNLRLPTPSSTGKAWMQG